MSPPWGEEPEPLPRPESPYDLLAVITPRMLERMTFAP